jgi:NAD(P)-dependent dehydrogenase (short-subunit alcohol dehydrogenase family)
MAALHAEAEKTRGPFDIVVANAGMSGSAPAQRTSLADWQRTLDVNLTGMFLCAQKAIPLLKQSANGSMVNLSSAAGRFGFALRSPYSASKWGVIGFSKSLSIELGGAGVRVNAICPGAVAGDRIDRVIAGKAKVRNVPFDVVRDEFLGKTSLKRFVSAEDIANAIVFLASKLGANIDGHALPIDGDVQSLG